MHPICTCSCLFTPLTEGRSARDLTQAAPSQKKNNISKEKRDAQFRCDAAAKVLTGSECVALERAELAWIFESLRAAVHVPFDFPNLVRVLWGFSNLQHAASRLPDFPDFRRLTELQQVFQEAGTRPVSKAICVRVLLSLVELKQRAQWPLGIVYLSNREGTTDVLYLGVPAAKLVLLVRHMPQEEIDVWVAGASAYKTGMTTTTSVRMLRPFIARQINHDLCTDETCVEMRGGWNRLSILGHQCLSEHCPLCIMVQLGLCTICPWHLGRPFAMHECLHLIGEVPANGQAVTITGHLNGYGGGVSLILLHVTHGMSELNSLQGFSEWKHHIQLDWVLPLLPNASTEGDFGGPLLIPFSSHGLPSCFYEHLFVLPGGTLASKPYLMSGAFTYEMTANLGCLNPHVIRSLKKVFKVILQSTFWHRFSFGCPSYISSIRSLSFLPHALGCEGGWRQISVSFLCHALELTTQDLNAYCESPLSIRARYPTGHWIAERALEHRLSTHQGLPTRLRHLSCWNINSWQYPKPPPGEIAK